MAFVFTENLATIVPTTGPTASTSTTFAVTVGDVIYAGLANRNAIPVTDIVSFGDDSGGAITWTQLANQAFDTLTSPTRRHIVYRGVAVSSATGITATADYGVTQTVIIGRLRHFTGADATTPEAQAVATNSSNSNTNINAIFGSAPTAGNFLLQLLSVMGDTPTITADTANGYTALAIRNSSGSSLCISGQYKDGGTETTLTCTLGSTSAWATVGIEVQAASGAGVAPWYPRFSTASTGWGRDARTSPVYDRHPPAVGQRWSRRMASRRSRLWRSGRRIRPSY